MAIINCPECGGKVSDLAETCPHCGYKVNSFNQVFAQDSLNSQVSATKSKKKKGKNKIVPIIITMIVLFVVLIAIVVSIMLKTNSQASYNKAVEYENTGDFESAVSMYKKVIFIDPNYKNAQARITEINNIMIEYKEEAESLNSRIASLAGILKYKQSELDSLKDEYDRLPYGAKKMVTNYSILENVYDMPTEYEEWACIVCRVLKNRLKNPDSLKIVSINFALNENEPPSSVQHCVFYLTYTGQNAFGGNVKQSCYVPFITETKKIYMEELFSFDEEGEVTYLLFKYYQNAKSNIIELDPDRIMHLIDLY